MSADASGLVDHYRRARQRRAAWESHWAECYEFALPLRGGTVGARTPGEKRTDRLFDGTAPDAVDQLAASLMAELTPPAGRWFGLVPGPDVGDDARPALAAELERTTRIVQAHFARSNFAVEIHQCYLDLVTAGTACLLFEESEPGEASAFRFTAVPLSEAVLEEGPSGRLDVTFRRADLTRAQLEARFPGAADALADDGSGSREPDAKLGVVEAVTPEGAGYRYLAVLDPDTGPVGTPRVLAEGRFALSPFINFRWLKAPGETYGRSPVMKALPDIKTANKVVELVLKNASIAVTGIWQADDDGVLNPAAIQLVPGTIIPKAVGSAGLTPLEAPGRFDVSEIVLEQLRGRIRKALLVDQLGQVDGPRMTATEVLERSAEMARILGATFGRLQSELLTPLFGRALAVLARRGQVPETTIDGRLVELDQQAPHARTQARREAQSTLAWLEALGALGPEALAVVDPAAVARWLGRAFGVPGELVREEGAGAEALVDGLAEIAGALAGPPADAPPADAPAGSPTDG